MKNLYLTFTLLFLLPFNVSAQIEDMPSEDGKIWPSSHFFRVLPENESHEIFGRALKNELSSASIKALVWNIKKAEMASWEKEFREYAEGRDLVLVQEAYGSDRFTSTTESFSDLRWDMGISFLFRRYGDTPTGTMIGSEAEPTQVVVKHSVDLEPVVDTPKSITFANYPVEGKSSELLVISVHAINFETTGAFKRQMDQVEAAVKAHSGPIFLSGDFNTWNASRTSYLFNLAERLGLSMVNFKNGDQRMSFRGYFLDHSFVKGMEIKSAEVMGVSSGSDHKPLLLEMSVTAD